MGCSFWFEWEKIKVDFLTIKKAARWNAYGLCIISFLLLPTEPFWPEDDYFVFKETE